MAEVAAGAGILLAAEEVLSTTAQVGVATYFLTKPTQPLKATFARVAVADDSDLERRSLTRSNHSLTIINDKAYIFGGTTADGKLATNDVHVVNLAPEKNHEPDYQLIPAIKESGSAVPEARSQHASCAFKGALAVYGGTDSSGRPIDEGSAIRLFHPTTKTWDVLEPRSLDAGNVGPGPRVGARLFAHQDSLIVYCGNKSAGEVSNEVWVFDATDLDFSKEKREKADKAEDTLEIEHNAPPSSWSRLPNPPVATEASNAALYGDNLYVISSTDAVSSQLHILPLSPQKDQEQKWATLTFPTNPIIPGPRARHGGALVPITTGYGRNYLIYLLGAREQDSSTSAEKWQQASIASDPDELSHGKQAAQEVTQWSDTWTLQLPSSSLQPKPALNIKDAIKPAKIKDAIRSSVGAESGKWSWSEVEVQVPNELGAEAGKLHPGPRAFFGADVLSDGQSVVFWGGEGADGEKVGDGWVLRLS